MAADISVGGRGKGATAPKLGKNPFHSGKFSEGTIGNSGKFSACSPVLLDISGRKFSAPPLNLTSSYAHGCREIRV